MNGTLFQMSRFKSFYRILFNINKYQDNDSERVFSSECRLNEREKKKEFLFTQINKRTERGDFLLYNGIDDHCKFYQTLLTATVTIVKGCQDEGVRLTFTKV